MRSSAGQSKEARSLALRLSTLGRAVTRGRMPKPRSSLPDRLILSLCALLMALYAATIPAKAANQLQHAPSFMMAHDHKDAADVSVDVIHDSVDHHAVHHDGAPDGDEEPGDPASGGHHHHGDNGPNLLVPDAATAPTILSSSRLQVAEKDRHVAGLRSIGPERPPRTASLNA